MSSIRALAVELAARSDDALRTLFDARPDLVSPPVPDFAALAARACARASVARALDKLDLPQTQVLEAVHLSTNEDLERTATAATLQPLIEGSSPDVLDGILDQLRALALLYRAEPEGYLPVSSLKDVIGVHPAGLGRSYVDLVRSQTSVGTRLLQSVQALHRSDTGIAPAATPMEAALAMGNWLAQAGSLEQLLKSAPEHTAGILSRFSAGPVGTLPKDRHGVGTGRATSPLDWLLARGLLVALDAEHVELPSDVALVLRGGVVIRGFATTAPVPELQTISEARRSNAALGSIAETLRLLTELLAQVRDHPLATLRAGGVGVREVRRLADSLRIGQERVGLLLELAALSGLLVLDVDTSRWRPADNGWLQLPREEQWARIATSWLRSDRAPSLVGQATVHRPAAGGSGSAAAASRNTGQPAAAQATATINALAAEVHRPDAPVLRQQTLAIMAELAAGAAAPAAEAAEPAAGAAEPSQAVPVLDADAIQQRFAWRHPRLARRLRRLLPGFLAEAELLGITGSGALTLVGAALAQGDTEQAVALLRESLPPALAHVLLQADLTAIAPGYLSPELSAELNLLAQPEGQGPATIYRFSATSIRRALDAGRDAEQILDFLARHSATETPQPLRYLVEDTASRHGRLRVGGVASYLQSDDDGMLAELLGTPSLAPLGLQALAPTVLVSRAGPRELALALRELGLAPALADADDAVVRVGRPSPIRPVSGWPAAGEAPATHTGQGAEEITAQLATLRSGPSSGIPSTEAAPQLGLEVLRKAIRLKSLVHISMVDGLGNQEQQILVPLSVSGGRVRVYDPRREMERVVSIHRVMDVELVEGGPATAGAQKDKNR
ncbi:MAG TPA: helicase-associated domain-containing protein [Micrococcaceae bacterium]|jgi:hypothetical protein|nr:helicase-associated domain-containing protein [Micrococcaceae bacterium]